MAKEVKEETAHTPVNTKQMLRDLGEQGASFRYSDRINIEYVKDYGRRKAGEKAEGTNKLRGEWLIAQGFAKELKATK